MKAFAILAVSAACLAGLGGCVTPMYSYDEVHVRGWTHESLDQRFPVGTSATQVFEKLGSPFATSAAGDLSRWDYVGGVSGQLHVVLLFKNSALIQKQFVNF
ncbi:hypothetical protein [Burkholderia sp. S171]|uniref:hypothetical protein n=1 Tax=Burkholderia sp. S171 TaxID=1641860 RepID=UPI00131AE635|nr:hypothetical protein [Burkholderia sp. S171]